MKLLIADDSLTQRVMLQAIAKKWGFDIVLAEDGNQAWEVLSGPDAPRLVLLDWEMPGMDGPEVCRRVREIETEDPPYILLLTSRSETDDIVAGLSAGANDYISKPFNNAELLARAKVGKRMLKLQSELAKAKATLEFQASHDVLTGLMNRRAIMEALDKEMARSQRNDQVLSVGIIDIDHFKQINDTYGHGAGDDVLKEVSQRMKAALRPYDHLGRYGGEEFLAVLNVDNGEELTPFERMRSMIADKPFMIDNTPLNVTISCGVRVIDAIAGESIASDFIATADTALYEAKESGRNRVIMAKAE